MKKYLSLTALVLIAYPAGALENVLPRDACSRLQPQANEDACYQLIVPGARFDELAVGVCDQMKGSKDTLSCMREVQYGTFESRAAIRVCGRLETASNIIECIGAIKYEHIDDRAVLACDRIKDSDTTVECMEAIAGKKYTQSDINKCDSLSSSEDTVDCFEDEGKENPNDFELGGRRAAAANASTASTGNKRTLDLRQFLQNCPPDKQDNNNNSDVVDRLKHWDDIVHRASKIVK